MSKPRPYSAGFPSSPSNFPVDTVSGKATIPPSSFSSSSPSASAAASAHEDKAAMFSLQSCAGSEYLSLNVGGKTFLTTRFDLLFFWVHSLPFH